MGLLRSLSAPVVTLAMLATVFVVSPGFAAGDPSCRPAPAADETHPLDALAGLPAGWSAHVAFLYDRVPPTPTVVAVRGGTACDLTRGLAAFAAHARVEDAEQRAALAAASLYPDALGVPQPVVVGRDGAAVLLESWSERNGLVVAWRVDPATLAASFTVLDVGVGDYALATEGPAVRPGSTQLDLPGVPRALAAKTLHCPNADTTSWRIRYWTEDYASEAEADAYAAAYCDAARVGYALQTLTWGFPSIDPDGVLDITNDGCTCIFAGDHVEIHLDPKLEEFVALFGVTYPEDGMVYRAIIGHEYHHHLQWSLQGWRVGGALIEGGARFSETLVEPVGSHQPGSIVYHPSPNGFPWFMLQPNTPLGGRVYDAGLYWGTLYAEEGGLPFLRTLYEESATVGGFGNHAVVTAVERALVASGAPHPTFAETYARHAAHMLARSFVWGLPDGSHVLDWGAHLPEVATPPFAGAPGGPAAASGTVQDRGLQVARLGAASGDLVTHFRGATNQVTAHWLGVRADGTFVVQPAGETTVFTGGPYVTAGLGVSRGFIPVSAPGGLHGVWAAAVEPTV